MSQAIVPRDDNGNNNRELNAFQYPLSDQALAQQASRSVSSTIATISLYPTADELNLMFKLAGTLVDSNLAPYGIDTPQKALIVMLKGRELGLPMMQALAHISVINGKPTLSAALMLTLAERAGHKWWIVETSATRCEMAGYRAGDPSHIITSVFTIEEASKAGLTTRNSNSRGKSPWEAYPEDMLFARCSARHARRLDPAQLGKNYTPEEMGADVTFDESGQQIVVSDLPNNQRTAKSSANSNNNNNYPHQQPQPARPTPANNNRATTPVGNSAANNTDKVPTPLYPNPTKEQKAALIDAAIAVGKKFNLKELRGITRPVFISAIAQITSGLSPEDAAAEMGFPKLNMALRASDLDLTGYADDQKLELALLLVDEWFKQNRPDLVANNDEAAASDEEEGGYEQNYDDAVEPENVPF